MALAQALLGRELLPEAIDLRQQVHITYWSDNHLLSKPLLDLLPFGRALSASQFYYFVDYLHPTLLREARRNLAYWQLTNAQGFGGETHRALSLFYDETFFWHFYIPKRQETIKAQLRTGNRVRFLSRFSVTERKVEVEFNEIRLLTSDERHYQLIYTDSKEYTYLWTNRFWETRIVNHDTSIVNPRIYMLPLPVPNFFHEQAAYLEKKEQVLRLDRNLSLETTTPSTEYWNSVESTPELSRSSTPEYINARNIPAISVVCACGIDVCRCNNARPDTPLTPPGITLWNPRTTALPIPGIHYFRHAG